MKSGFHVLAPLVAEKTSAHYVNIDDVSRDLANELGIAPDSFDRLYDAEFRVLGQKVPRQTSEASGRTALFANINVNEQKPPSDPDTPLAYSMEGARKKIPLPLISAPWAPKWNSVQSSFKTILSTAAKGPDAFGGVRLFTKTNAQLPASNSVTAQRKVYEAPHFYVLPKHNIFAGFTQARFSSALATRMPEVEAEISPADAKKLGFTSFAPIVLESEQGHFSLLAKTKADVPDGIILLPFGLVDASLFFSSCLCRVMSKEHV